MRRADRLFQIVQILRCGRIVTAARMARELGVSERTVYRDVSDLSSSGVPVESEAGVGYRLRGYDLPPLMFGTEEVEALVLGARIVAGWTDPELARAARSVLSKVEAVLPDDREHLVRETMLFAPRGEWERAADDHLPTLRAAIRHRHLLHLDYLDRNQQPSERRVRPLGLAFFGPTWLLVAWCELRQDFRCFRPDRIQHLQVLAETYAEEAGKTYPDFVAKATCDRSEEGRLDFTS